MNLKHSLRFRIILLFCFYGTILSAIYGVLLLESFKAIEDAMLNDRLRIELDQFFEKYKKNSSTPLPDSPFMTSYIGIDQVPAKIRAYIQTLPEGTHEFGEKAFELFETDMGKHVGIRQLPERKEKLYLVYDVTALEVTERSSSKYFFVFSSGLFMVMVIGLCIGIVTARQVIVPVKKLANLIRSTQPDQIPTNLSDDFYKDEVGLLAQAFEVSMNRIAAFVEREKNFTRDSSHELRSPLTVIKGAVEVIEASGQGDGKIHRPLQRIKYSVADMENAVDTFLWLARAENGQAKSEKTELIPVVKASIDRNRYILKNKPVAVELISENSPVISAPQGALAITVDNLLRNAFQYTTRGNVDIRVTENTLEISDTGGGVGKHGPDEIIKPYVQGENSQGFGIGLSIVKRICERFDWRFDIQSSPEKGTVITLHFSQIFHT